MKQHTSHPIIMPNLSWKENKIYSNSLSSIWADMKKTFQNSKNKNEKFVTAQQKFVIYIYI